MTKQERLERMEDILKTMKETNKQKILQMLKQLRSDDNGLSIETIASRLGCSWGTAQKYVIELDFEGRTTSKKIGRIRYVKIIGSKVK